MRLSDVQKGKKVSDRWFPDNGIGEIISVKENEIRVKYPSAIVKYNKLSIGNLEIVNG